MAVKTNKKSKKSTKKSKAAKAKKPAPVAAVEPEETDEEETEEEDIDADAESSDEGDDDEGEDDDEDEEDADDDDDDDESDDDEDNEEEKPAPKKRGAKKGVKRGKVIWKNRQLMRLVRIEKQLAKLERVTSAAKAPGVNAEGVSIALSKLQIAQGEISKLGDDWKPARGHNPGNAKSAGIGSRIKVKDGLEGDDLKVFKHIPATLYTNGEIVETDGHNWLVKCADGMTRTVRKKYVTLV